MAITAQYRETVLQRLGEIGRHIAATPAPRHLRETNADRAMLIELRGTLRQVLEGTPELVPAPVPTPCPHLVPDIRFCHTCTPYLRPHPLPPV